MSDKTNNPMPQVESKKARAVLAWISWAFLLGGPSLTAYVAMLAEGRLKTGLIIILGLMVVVATAIKTGLTNVLKKAGPALLVLAFLAPATSCKGPYHAAWVSLDGILKARNETAKALATVVKAKHEQCLKDHGSKTQAYADCIKAEREAIKQWQKNYRPGINSGAQTAAAGLEIAKRAGGDGSDWLDYLKVVGCLTLRVTKQWAHYLGDKLKGIMGFLKPIEGVICD